MHVVNQTKKKIWFFSFLALIAYLLINTGIVSDDFTYTVVLKNKSFIKMLLFEVKCFTTPFENFTHFIWYPLFRLDNFIVAEILKIFYIALSFYFVTKFFSLYLNQINAYIASFLFLFFPSHDSTTYWFLGQYLTLSMAFYLYAYYLAYRNRFWGALLMALAASFVSYGSPVIALSLFLVFLLDKKLKKGLVLLIPNVIYSVYYVFLTQVLKTGTNRIPLEINIPVIARQFILQIVTFTDSMIGPSMWLKIYYSFSQLTITSLIIGVLLVVVFYKTYEKRTEKYNRNLVLGLTALTGLSFAMFAVTGFYPQLAFNLGNRVTIFGSLLLTYLIVLMPLSRKWKTALFALIIFSILGISDHWKEWNTEQQRVIETIKNNQSLKNYKDKRIVYVAGNQYSKYGPISHIEFFSENMAVDPLLNFLTENSVKTAEPINKRHKYEDGYLVDTKYKWKKKVDRYIVVYDSDNNTLFRVAAGEINKFIDSLPAEKRHWVQIIKNDRVRGLILKLMPRLEYAL